MANGEKFSFSDYRNFEFDGTTPLPPVKNVEDLAASSPDLHHGAFTTTIELDENTVIKLNRLVRSEIEKKDGDKEEVVFMDKHVNGYLVPRKGEDPETVKEEKAEVTRKMLELAKHKREIYETMGRYIGNYLPEIKFFAVVDSPRRELERSVLRSRMRKEPDPAVLDQIPNRETTLMEVWENIHPFDTLTNQRYERLKGWFDNEGFRTEIQGFAQGAYELLLENRMIVDISGDRRGIRVIHPNAAKETLSTVKQLHELLEQDENTVIALPRNTAFTDGKIKYFDTHPGMYIPQSVTLETVRQFAQYLQEGNWETLDILITKEEPDNSLFGVLSYLVLLKKIGAEF